MSNVAGPTQVFAFPGAVPEVLRLLREAERSIRMTAYTLDHQGALASMEALARRGGVVAMLVDFSTPKGGTVRRESSFLRTLLEAGGLVRTFSAKRAFRIGTKC